MSEAPEILATQERLARALSRARAGEDRELASQVRTLGETFARLLAGSTRMTRIHDLENAAFEMPLRELESTIAELRELLGAIQLVMVEEQVYVNDIRIRFDPSSETARDLNQIWRRHGVGGVIVHSALNRAQLRALLAAVAEDPAPAQPRAHLSRALEEDGVLGLELQPVFRFLLTGERKREQRAQSDINQIFRRASGAVDQLWQNLAAGRTPNPLPIRRMVTELVELGQQDRVKSLVNTFTDRQTPAYTRHSMTVATLSVMLGRALGLDETTLSDLGVAATFHDVGYSLDEDGFPPPFERHGTAGARQLLAQRGFHESRIRRMLVCLQHHERYDATPRPSVLSRIVRIADDYDTFTRFRQGGPKMVPPDAIRTMYRLRGTLYDPHLTQLFVNLMGRFPPGSILELSDGSWGLSLTHSRHPSLFSKPALRIVRPAPGSGRASGYIVDLARDKDLRVKKVVRPRDVRTDETEAEASD